MRLYRKIIPKIARDVVRGLNANEQIEIEEGQIEEAELDLAAVLVEYMNEDDRVSQEAKDAMSRRGMSHDRFGQVKKSIADARGFKIGEDGLEYALNQMLEALFSSKNIVEIYAEDHELRKFIKECMDKYLSVDEDLDKEARNRLKNIKEGTPEWEIEYPRMIAQLKRHRGLV